MTQRPPLLTLLASLVAHGATLGVLFLETPGEPVASALVIDLSELESASDQPGPKNEHAGSRRLISRAAAVPSTLAPPAASPSMGTRARVEPAPSAVARPAPSIPEPTPPPERAMAPSRPPESRPPEPADSPSEEAPAALARGAPSVPAAATNPVGASADQAGQASGVSVGRSATSSPQTTTGGSAPDSGHGVAPAPVGPPGGALGSEYGAYYRQIRQRIQETLEYPPAARRQGIKGTVLLELLIKPDGVISAVVKVSSSHRMLDDAALETVRNLPRQPFPPGLVPKQLTVPLPVVFDLK